MRGITKDRLIFWFNLFSSKNLWAELEVIRTLLDECKELTPWQPIDENAPKDREILLFYSCYKTVGGWNAILGYWVNEAGCQVSPTHWCELPEDPK